MLLFKKKFLDAVRCGAKTQTIRRAKVCRYRSGQRSYIPGVGYIRITAVDNVRLDELTDIDARLDGFISAEALRDELRTLYADSPPGERQAFRIRFRLCDAEETAAAVRDRAARKAGKR